MIGNVEQMSSEALPVIPRVRLKACITTNIAGSQLAAKEPLRSGYDAWVQAWVQQNEEKWLPISRKRHQIGHLDFRLPRLLTEGLSSPSYFSLDD
jgi:hypothetical protein